MKAWPATTCAAPSLPAASFSAPQSFLAFDFGTRRIGVALGNTLTRSATALQSVQAVGAKRFESISELVARWQPQALVVGVPFYPNGEAHDNTRRARRFARQLSGRFRLPVHEVDERYSTTEARTLDAGDVDAAAAAIILEQFFRDIGNARYERPAS